MSSRVAKNPVSIPKNVEVHCIDQQITVKGKLGQLSQSIPIEVKFTQKRNALQFYPANTSAKSNALSGAMRSLFNNMVRGVTEGFEIRLIIIGVGYRAKAEDNRLNLTVGFSHPVNLPMPNAVAVETPTPREIILKGIDKQQIGQVAAVIRAIRPPEPYKGKGILYKNEKIVLKEVKKK